MTIQEGPIHRLWPYQGPLSSDFEAQNGPTRPFWYFQEPISKTRLLKSEQIPEATLRGFRARERLNCEAGSGFDRAQGLKIDFQVWR